MRDVLNINSILKDFYLETENYKITRDFGGEILWQALRAETTTCKT